MVWDPSSTDVLRSMADALRDHDFLPSLVSRWSQESSQNIASPELRVDNVTYMKSLGGSAQLAGEHMADQSQPRCFKMNSWNSCFPLWSRCLRTRTASSNVPVLRCSLVSYEARYRLFDRRYPLNCPIGSKHWPKQWRDQLWGWFMSNVQALHNNIRPDTLSFWDAAFNVSCCMFSASVLTDVWCRNY